MSHMVQVVSILEVMIKLGDKVFQSRDVSGAVCSGDFELDKRASGVSFCGGCEGLLVERFIELPGLKAAGCEGNDHNLR